MTNLHNSFKHGSILVVDDNPENIKVLTSMLKLHGYKVRALPNGNAALRAIKNNPPDLILLDINMPDMNGYMVCESLKEDEELKEIPIIFISALNETWDKLKAFSVGGIDYVTKPFQFDEVQARIDTHMKLRYYEKELEKHNKNLEAMVEAKVKEITEAQISAIFSMAKLAQSRDDDTGKHLQRVQIFCKLLASKLSCNEKYKNHIDADFIENIFQASPLHDIGKVGIPDSILLKPGKLTSEEFELMKNHTSIGAATMEEVKSKYPENSFFNMGIDIALYHHEKWQGNGYPHGLKGETIPLSARLMAVADVYDALKSKRCYKPPFCHEKCCNIIYEESGSHFDPDIVEAFRDINLEFFTNWESLKD